MKLAPIRGLRRMLHRLAHDETFENRNRSAVVFAPHQDDETLACGGTIILKRTAGTPVKIVFMGDGTTSHDRFMKPTELHQIRRQEAIDAARMLGLATDDLEFLDFPESNLGNHHDAAVTQVLSVLQRDRPEEIYVPYRRDGTPDHEATYRIVVEAAKQSGLKLYICEYPIWFWNQWPWISLRWRFDLATLSMLRRILRSMAGLVLLMRFRSSVLIREVADRKRKALDQHQSQMEERHPGVGWPTLSGVSDGEFLECLLQDHEFFYRWQMREEQSSVHPPRAAST